MQVNSSVTYVGIAILGGVLATLYATVAEDLETAYLIIFNTVYVICTLRFLLEWKYYRSHNAILASSQFLLLPFIILVSGLFLQPRIGLGSWAALSLSLGHLSTIIVLNPLSIALGVPILILMRLFSYYHSKRWLGFAIRRRLFKSRTVPIGLHILFVAVVGGMGQYLGLFDVTAIIFGANFLFLVIKYSIQPLLNKRRSRLQSRQGGYLDDFLSNPQQVRRYSSRSNSAPPVAEEARPARRRGNIPLVSRNGQREISTNYKNARSISARGKSHREISPTSTQSRTKPKTTKAKSKSTSSRTSVAQVDTGKELRTMSAKGARIVNTDPLLPSGNISKEDLACIICYDEFTGKDGNVVLCKFCKYPAHEGEFIAWMQNSTLCPRCSKEIPHAYIANPTYRLSTKEYLKSHVSKV